MTSCLLLQPSISIVAVLQSTNLPFSIMSMASGEFSKKDLYLLSLLCISSTMAKALSTNKSETHQHKQKNPPRQKRWIPRNLRDFSSLFGSWAISIETPGFASPDHPGFAIIGELLSICL